MAQLYPRALGSFHIASDHSQGYSEVLLTRLHTGLATTVLPNFLYNVSTDCTEYTTSNSVIICCIYICCHRKSLSRQCHVMAVSSGYTFLVFQLPFYIAPSLRPFILSSHRLIAISISALVGADFSTVPCHLYSAVWWKIRLIALRLPFLLYAWGLHWQSSHFSDVATVSCLGLAAFWPRPSSALEHRSFRNSGAQLCRIVGKHMAFMRGI
jgi:hypothetical protein